MNKDYHISVYTKRNAIDSETCFDERLVDVSEEYFKGYKDCLEKLFPHKSIIIIPSTTKAFKLPKEFFNKWLEALSSDQYIQGHDALCKDITGPKDKNKVLSYCCLGVACHVSGIPNDKIRGYGFISELKGEDVDIDDVPEPLIDMGSQQTLANVVAFLNDGYYFTDYQKIIRNFPNIRGLPKPKPGDDKDKYTHTFAEIVEFLEQNVETY
jgi:hypothetical protein